MLPMYIRNTGRHACATAAPVIIADISVILTTVHFETESFMPWGISSQLYNIESACHSMDIMHVKYPGQSVMAGDAGCSTQQSVCWSQDVLSL